MSRINELEQLQTMCDELKALISQNNLSQAILLSLDIAIRLKGLKGV